MMRFRDEWLLRMASGFPGFDPARVEHWRQEGRQFLSQELIECGVATPEQISRLLRDSFRIDSADIEPGAVDKRVLRLIPEKVCKRYMVLPIKADERTITLAMANPLDHEAIQDVTSLTGREVVPVFCTVRRIAELTADELSADAVIFDLLRNFEASAPIEVVERESGEPADLAPVNEVRPPVVKLVDGIIEKATRLNASDIHIEHDENATLVRFRIDGSLKNMMQLPRYVGVGPMVSRIKIMAGLDLADRFRPQDGRAKLKVGKDLVGLRVSTLPTRTGEKVVMRILNERGIQATFDKIGFIPHAHHTLLRLLARDQGILLVTGPTGSGKTTTLYAGLNQVRTEAVNIVTVEDPVEYRLDGITQVQVNEKQGLTFAGALRSVLRQDPDVIMVGEIRDQETAMVAFQAALTGHLVISTLHTNDTISAVARLADMGVERFQVATGLLAVTAQRLVRRLCPSCAQLATPQQEDARVRRAQEQLGFTPKQLVAKGCAECGFNGYRGRLPLLELLEVSGALRERIAAGENPEKLHALALESGLLYPLSSDAMWHVAEGHTSVEEIAAYVELGSLEQSGAQPLPPEATIPVPVPEPVRPRAVLAVAEPMWRTVLATMLHDTGFDTEMVEDGASALGLLARAAPDLLVVAQDLPGLDGARVVQGLRTLLGLDLPVIAVLPTGGEAATAAMLACGANDVLAPPLDRNVIHARLRGVLERRTPWSDTREIMSPPVPVNEPARLQALRDTQLLDTPPEERFDRITREMTEHFGVEFAMLSLVDEDRQWFKSKQGTEAAGSAREVSFCGHAINNDDIFVVNDAALDPRFSENPFVTGPMGVRFYAGYPVSAPTGEKIGSLCIVGKRPRNFTDADAAYLRQLGQKVEEELRSGVPVPVPAG